MKGFRNEFEHVILNLINNAREAIIEKRAKHSVIQDERGLISFDFCHIDGKIIIAVGDNGGGLPENILSRIFEPYYTTKDPSKGTGLGLYMSKVIIEDHMLGKLTAKNSNGGAVFTIELPAAEERILK
jgi:signal transduction histidine kinase